MKESVVEKYLHAEVTKAGGTTRKFTGRVNNPDRIVIWPILRFMTKPVRRLVEDAKVHFVETKAPKKGPRLGQAREHKRLRDLGCKVFVINTKPMVDAYVANNR